jgi:predicted Fe-Mo cluster-binding NifX family protein
MINTQTGEKTRFENKAASSAGGAGIAAAQSIVDKGAEAVLVPRCGENAAKVLSSANIKLFRTVGESVTENIDAFSAGRLSELDNIHPGLHRHGG